MIYADKTGSELIFWNDEGKKYSYDFKDENFYSYNIGKTKKVVKSINRFFTHTHIYDIKWKNKDYKRFINLIQQEEKRCSNIGTFIQKIKQYLYLEAYFLLHIKLDIGGWKGKITKPPEFYNKKVLKMFAKHQIPISRNLENAFINYYDFLTDIFFCLDTLYDENRESRFFGEDLRQITFHADSLRELTKEYNYDTKHLLSYLCYLSDYEAIDIGRAIRQLMDYARMMSAMQDKYIKYPRNLHTTHDIVVRNFNNAKKKYDNELFKKVVKTQNKYEWKYRGYTILVPESTKDVQDEGCNLRHCVGGYINSIIEKRTKILFLRRIDNQEESLITLEVRGDMLVEARGFANRYVNKEEKDLLIKWCKEKDIKYKVRR